MWYYSWRKKILTIFMRSLKKSWRSWQCYYFGRKILTILNRLQKKNIKKLIMILLKKKRKHNNAIYNYWRVCRRKIWRRWQWYYSGRNLETEMIFKSWAEKHWKNKITDLWAATCVTLDFMIFSAFNKRFCMKV